MKNILLPTDFSNNSINAIKYAMAFFKNVTVNFFVINIQKTSDYTTSDMMSSGASSSVYQAVLEDNKLQLKKLMETLEKEYTSEKFSYSSLLDYDVFTDAIRQAINSNRIDLIVMGTNGATGAKEKIFGSNTLKVIRGVDCPLITVPERFQFENIKSILFSTQRKKFSFNKITPLKDILALHRAELSVLDLKVARAKTTSSESKSSLDKLFDGINYKYHTLGGIPPSMAITSFEQLFPVDLHAMFVEKETFMDRFLYGSETSKISYGSRVPLLIMHT